MTERTDTMKQACQALLNTTIRALSVFIMAALLLMPSAAVASAADPNAGVYCAEGFYQYANGQLKRLDPVNGTFMNIGVPVGAGVMNASGYDMSTGRMYSINSYFNANNRLSSWLNLVWTDVDTGAVTTVGDPVNAANPSQTLSDVMIAALSRPTGEDPTRNHGKGVSIGEVAGGKMYIAVGNQANQAPEDKDNNLYVIDLATNTFTRVMTSIAGTTAAQRRIGPDMVYSDGLLYSVNGYDGGRPRLNVFDPANGVGTSRVIDTLPNADDSYGGLWLAKDEDGSRRMFVYANSSGRIYEIQGFAGSGTVTTQLRADLESLNNNDGASCPEAPVPQFRVNAVNDSATTSLNTAVMIDWNDNDEAVTDDPFSLNSVDTTSLNGGTVADNGDGTFTYTPSAGFHGVDTFSYTICLDGVVPQECDTAIVTVSIDVVIDAQNDTDTTTINIPVSGTVFNNDSGSNPFSATFATKPTTQGGEVTINTDGTYTYTPATGFYGTDTFTYEICVDSADPAVCDMATVEIVIPAIIQANDDEAATDPDVPVVIDPYVNDLITDGLVYELCAVEGKDLMAASGTVTVNDDRTFTYTPGEGFTGVDSFTYTISEDCSNPEAITNQATVTITIEDGAVLGVSDENEPTVARDIEGAVLGAVSEQLAYTGFSRLLIAVLLSLAPIIAALGVLTRRDVTSAGTSSK